MQAPRNKTILDEKLFTATCKAVVNLTRVHSTLHRLATKPSDRAAARSLPSFTAMLLKHGEGCFLRAGGTVWSFLAGLWTLFYTRFKASKWATT